MVKGNISWINLTPNFYQITLIQTKSQNDEQQLFNAAIKLIVVRNVMKNILSLTLQKLDLLSTIKPLATYRIIRFNFDFTNTLF